MTPRRILPRQSFHAGLVLFLALIPCVWSAPLVNDAFVDGDFADGSDTLDTVWRAGASPLPTLSIVSDNTTGPDESSADNALQVATTNANGVLGTFSSTTLAIGETLTLGFDLRFTSTPTSATGLRFGLFNSNGTAYTAGTATTHDDNDSGYRIDVPTNTASTAPRVRFEGGTNGGLGAGNDALAPSTAGTFSNYNLGTTSTAFSFSITRTDATTVSFGLTIDGVNVITSIASDTDRSAFTFDEVFFGVSGASTYLLDNISVNVTAVPEPSTAATLLGITSLAFAARRRAVSVK